MQAAAYRFLDARLESASQLFLHCCRSKAQAEANHFEQLFVECRQTVGKLSLCFHASGRNPTQKIQKAKLPPRSPLWLELFARPSKA